MSSPWLLFLKPEHKMRRYLSLIFIMLFFGVKSLSGQELLSSTLSRDTIMIGDQIEWLSKFNIPAGTTLKIDSMAGYVVPGVELIGDFKIDTVKKNRSLSEVHAKATITSFDSGSYKMPPLVVYIYRGEQLEDTLRLKELPLEVTTIPVDTTTYQMFDLRSNFDYPVTFSEVAIWGGSALAVVALFVGIIYLIRRMRRKGAVEEKPKPKDPAHIVALRELDHISGEKLWQNGKEKIFYTKVTDALRIYIEDRYDIRTMERTSAEILSDFSKMEVKKSDFELLEEIFTVSDLVKFAKYTASQQENEETIPKAVKFVTNTYLKDE